MLHAKVILVEKLIRRPRGSFLAHISLHEREQRRESLHTHTHTRHTTFFSVLLLLGWHPTVSTAQHTFFSLSLSLSGARGIAYKLQVTENRRL